MSPHKDVQKVEPPKSLLKPWRAFVNQERPRQKKNPRWQSLDPRATVALEMHRDTTYRCIVTPLEVRGRADEEAQKVEAWVLSRKLRCSSDGWATWTEGAHTVVVDRDGTERPITDHLEMFLREREPGRKTRETTIFVRSDQGSKGLATTGPPRIIGGRPDGGDEGPER